MTKEPSRKEPSRYTPAQAQAFIAAFREAGLSEDKIVEQLDARGIRTKQTEQTKTTETIEVAPTGRPRKYDIGTKLGALTIVSRAGKNIAARCDCGNTIRVTITTLTQGRKRNCTIGAQVCGIRQNETERNEQTEQNELAI